MRVLYPTDGGKAARAGAELLARIGRRDEVELTVLSVSDLKGIDAGVTLDDPTGPIEKSRMHAAEVVRRATTELAATGFRVSGQVAEGSAAVEIVRLLEHDPHDLILIGAGNKTWLDRLLHGSVSTHLLHSSPISVLVVHEASSNGQTRVLVADDGSKSADAAQELLVELAQPERCNLSVIGVVTPLDVAVVPDPASFDAHSVPLDPVEVADLEKARIVEVRDRVEAARARLREAGFRVDADVVVGHPAPEILEKAKEGHYDLVVLGSRGLGAVGRALLGSVSDAVSRHARAALVSRRAPDDR